MVLLVKYIFIKVLKNIIGWKPNKLLLVRCISEIRDRVDVITFNTVLKKCIAMLIVNIVDKFI